MSHDPKKDIRIAVVGGGITGLTCAVILAKAGLNVIVFEAAPQLGEVGAGVALGPNALRVLEAIGIHKSVLERSDEVSPSMTPFLYLSGTGDHQELFDYKVCSELMAAGIYRPAYLEALAPMLDPNILKFNMRCVSVERQANSKACILHFSNGQTFEADLVIGADGIKSNLRSFVKPDAKVMYSGRVAYRAMLPADTLRKAGVKTDMASRALCWVGKDKHWITFSVNGGQNVYFFLAINKTDTNLPQINIVIFAADPPPATTSKNWVQSASQAELKEKFEDWGPDAKLIINQIKEVSKWYLHYLDPPLQRYIKDRVALVGDAAHATLPHLGAGAGQGIEDAFVLSKLLLHPKTNVDNLDAALEAYNTLRVPRGNMVVQESTKQGKRYENYGPGLFDDQDIPEQYRDRFQPVWSHDLSKEVDRKLTDMYGSSH